MKEINVNFIQQSGKNTETDVPEDLVLEDALNQLVEIEELAPLQTKQYWIVSFKETGAKLDIDKTMAENGVKDGDSLRVIVGGVA